MLRLSDKTVAARDLLPGDIIRQTGARVAEVHVRDEVVDVRFKEDVWFAYAPGKKIDVCRGVIWP